MAHTLKIYLQTIVVGYVTLLGPTFTFSDRIKDLKMRIGCHQAWGQPQRSDQNVIPGEGQGTPISQEDCPKACKSVVIDCEGEIPPGGNEPFPHPPQCADMCVARVGDGSCRLFISINSPAHAWVKNTQNPEFSCFGKPIPVTQWSGHLDRLMGRVRDTIDKPAVDITAANDGINQIKALCVLADERSNLENQNCCENRSCDEALSTEAQATCLQAFEGIVQNITRRIRPPLVGHDPVVSYCVFQELLRRAAKVESCICTASRNVTGLTMDSCEQCVQAKCGVWARTLVEQSLCSLLRSPKAEPEIQPFITDTCRKWFEDNPGHSCDAFVQDQVVAPTVE